MALRLGVVGLEPGAWSRGPFSLGGAGARIGLSAHARLWRVTKLGCGEGREVSGLAAVGVWLR